MHVTPDSPAQRCGVRVGDTIVTLGGAPLRTTKDLIDGLGESVGKRVAMEVVRGEKKVEVSCHVESMQQ